MNQLRQVFIRSLFIIIAIGTSTISAAADDPAQMRNSNVKIIVDKSLSQSVKITFGFEKLKLDNATLNSSHSFGNNTERIDRFGLGGEGITYQSGRPIMPAVSRYVIVPPQSGLELIVRSDSPQKIKAERPPATCRDQGVLLNNRTGNGNEDVFPVQIAEMSAPSIIRGVRIVKVTTHPLQYDSATNEYIYHPHIETEIVPTNAEPVNPVTNPIRRNRSREFLKFIKALVINGDDVGRDDPDRDQPLNRAGHYLVVTNEHCLEYAVPFIEWRRMVGFKVDIITVSDQIGSNPNQVKELIQESYDNYLDEGIDPFDQILLIGDRESYISGPDAQWVLGAERGVTAWNNPNHADYLYACLEGNDHHPDAGISRWASGSADLMRLAVERTLAYEADPEMNEPEWFTRGAVYAQWAGHGQHTYWRPYQHTNMRWVEQTMQNHEFEELEIYDLMEWDRQGERIHPFLRDRYNEGCNLMIGVASNYNWRREFADVEENDVFPIDLSMGEHSDFMGYMRFRTGSGNDLKGAVATTFTYGDRDEVAPHSTALLGLVKSFINHDLTLGWSRVYAITFIELFFPDINIGNHNLYQLVKTDFEFLGDPGIQPWIGIPRDVEAEINIDEFSPTTRLIEVTVLGEDDELVEGALVSLYAPGEIPEADDEDFADYEDIVQMTQISNQDGIARFILTEDVELIPETPIRVTVTGRNIRPDYNLEEIVESPSLIELLDFELTETEGNDDGQVNPGEIFNLSLTAANLSDEDRIEDVTGVVTSSSQWIEIEENEIEFGDIEPGENADGDEPVQLIVDPACPDGLFRVRLRPLLHIEFRDGDNQTWTSAIEIDPVSQGFTLSEVVGGIIIPTEEYELDIEIENVGRLDSPELSANLHSLGIGISVFQDQSLYDRIESGESSVLEGDPFMIIGNALSIPGSKTEMMLTLDTEEGFVDTVYFSLQTGESRENAPQGPDDYGYICYDDTDADWEISPEYAWIEISLEERDRDFDGTELEFEREIPHDIGESIVIELPFLTQFYGIEYDHITICTKGFIAMGEQPRITNYQPFPMDKAIGGGAGMLAPFWGDIELADDGHVYTYYDEQSEIYIIEWYNFSFNNARGEDITFQIILYNPEIWRTYTGDGLILFQYKSIDNRPNVREERWAIDIPYASVGISSPDGTTGINYTFSDVYPITSAEIENQRAILFTSSLSQPQASILGVVLDAETGEPLDSVLISTRYGFTARNDNDDGTFEIETFSGEVELTFHRSGYNTLTILVEVEDNGVVEIEVRMTHPEFVSSVENIEESIEPGESVDVEFEISNEGNGLLSWSASKHLVGDADREPWELRQAIQAGEIVEDNHLRGVLYIEETFYVSGSNDGDPVIYAISENGELVNTIQQPIDDRYGMRDLAWDGELIWGAINDSIYGITLDGEVESRFVSEFRPTSNITWDSNTGVLWVSGVTTTIIGYDREGNRVEGAELDRHALYSYGLAYYSSDPDGCNLYVFHKDRTTNNGTIHKFDTETGDTMFVHVFEDPDAGLPSGAYITSEIDIYSLSFLNIANISAERGGDRIENWQLDVNKDWMIIDDDFGGLFPDSSQQLTLTLDSEDLAEAVYIGELHFRHNARGGITVIPIEFEISPNSTPKKELPIPGKFEIVSAYPNPFNSTITIDYSLSKSGEFSMQVFNIMGQLIDILDGGYKQAGKHSVVLSADNMSSGLYFVRLEAGDKSAVKKVLLVR